MNADPDFHPLASAWLDGTATPPEQQLLREILHEPDMMPEYASLCRTETLLLQRGLTADARRAALDTLLRGKPWPRRITGIWQHRSVRWAAAAVVVGGVTLALWPDHSGDQDRLAKKGLTPFIEGPVAPGDPRDANSGEPLPPAEIGLEEKLRRYWVQDFKASGSLHEVAAKVVSSVHLKDDPAPAADVRGEGGATAYLQPCCPLPAWTLLQMAAVQTGTEIKLSGHSVVFCPARRPVSITGTAQRTTDVHILGALFSAQGPMVDYAAATEAAKQFFRSGVVFRAPPPSDSALSGLDPAVPYSGTPRDVRVMELALEAAAKRPPELQFATHSIVVPAGMTSLQLLAQLGITPSGKGVHVLTAEQMEVLRNDPSVSVTTTSTSDIRLSLRFHSLISFAGSGDEEADRDKAKQELEATRVKMKELMVRWSAADRIVRDPLVNPELQKLKQVEALKLEEMIKAMEREIDGFRRQIDQPQPGKAVDAAFEVTRNENQGVDMLVALSLEQPTPGETHPGANKQELNTNVMLDSGSTLFVSGAFRLTDGRELAVFVTPTLLDINDPPQETPPAPPGAQEDLPYGIPVVDKKGMVYSPYAPEKGQIDVDGFKRGTRVECPYTGKHFRVP